MDQARLMVTWGGSSGDLLDPVDYNATDGDIKQWATEAVRNGNVTGIPADPNANFDDFVVDRFASTAEMPARLSLRSKTPFGM